MSSVGTVLKGLVIATTCQAIVGQIKHLHLFEGTECLNCADIACQALVWKDKTEHASTWGAYYSCPGVVSGINPERIVRLA